MALSYMVYDSSLGSSSARPILRWGDAPDAAAVSDQAINANEVVVTLSDLSVFEGAAYDDELTQTYDFTYNTSTLAITAATPSADTTILAARALLRIQRLLDESNQYVTGERLISPARILLWLIYRNDLRGVPSQGGYPGTITWPTPPSATDNDTEAMLLLTYNRRNVLDTVGKNGLGVPNGGLFENGATGNGRYVRFADGNQICYHAQKALYFNSTLMPFTWTFPAAFDAADHLSVTPMLSARSPANVLEGIAAGAIRGCQVYEVSHSGSLINMQVGDNNSSLVPGDFVWVYLQAMGRWG